MSWVVSGTYPFPFCEWRLLCRLPRQLTPTLHQTVGSIDRIFYATLFSSIVPPSLATHAALRSVREPGACAREASRAVRCWPLESLCSLRSVNNIFLSHQTSTSYQLLTSQQYSLTTNQYQPPTEQILNTLQGGCCKSRHIGWLYPH